MQGVKPIVVDVFQLHSDGIDGLAFQLLLFVKRFSTIARASRVVVKLSMAGHYGYEQMGLPYLLSIMYVRRVVLLELFSLTWPYRL